MSTAIFLPSKNGSANSVTNAQIKKNTDNAAFAAKLKNDAAISVNIYVNPIIAMGRCIFSPTFLMQNVEFAICNLQLGIRNL